MTFNTQAFASGYAPPIYDQALWSWTTSGASPIVNGYPVAASQQWPNGIAKTKTGLTPQDLQGFIGVPLQYYGNPPVAIPLNVLFDWIRQAEDIVEQETSILLCQTWVASPAALQQQTAQACGLLTVNGNGQQIGLDYDLADMPYDFQFPRAQDEGWMYQTIRYRPVQSVAYGQAASGNTNAALTSYSGMKSYAFIYPLLNVFFQVAPQWFVVDSDFGLLRLVPATNTQLLPLFAMQLAFLGFAENVPGAIWLQYTAGLTPFDYQNRFSFIKQLVLAEASIIAFNSMQGTVNLGAEGYELSVDGMASKTKYPVTGAFGPNIMAMQKRRDFLMSKAQNMVAGPMINVL